MSEFNVDEFYKSVLELKTTEAVDAAFEPLLKNHYYAQREAIGKVLEDKFLEDRETYYTKFLKDMIDDHKAQGAELAKAWVVRKMGFDERTSGEKEVAAAQVANQVAFHIEELCDYNASPLTKAFNNAAVDLTDAEYNRSAVAVKPRLAFIDAYAAQEGYYKPNPLRDKRCGPGR
jgi:hypothetical protein